mgnify:FL=1
MAVKVKKLKQKKQTNVNNFQACKSVVFRAEKITIKIKQDSITKPVINEVFNCTS